MKKVALAILLSVMLSCGNDNSSNTAPPPPPTPGITGNWSATLTGSTKFSFTARLTLNSDTTITAANVNFGHDLCFPIITGQSGYYAPTPPSNMTPFSLTIGGQSSPLSAGTNTLILGGALNDITITGNWNSYGLDPRCDAQSGTFTMTKTSD